jgi:hypothetical protein
MLMVILKINPGKNGNSLLGFVILFLLAILNGCGTSAQKKSSNNPVAKDYINAEAIFHKDPRWLGSDAALSIPLTNDRILWLFGDTFIATSEANIRSESEMVRNTIAIQKGNDPIEASSSFYWRENNEGTPTSFFPENEEHWYWPGHGIRLKSGPLIIFLYSFIETPDEGLGFANSGYSIAVIDDPDISPNLWSPLISIASTSEFDAIPATAVIQDGEYIIAIAIRQNGTHAGALVRYPVSDIARGILIRSEWWAGDKKGWLPESAIGEEGPFFIIDDAGSECSVHWDKRIGSFVHIASYGFGATTIGMRTATSLTGPWSDQKLIYTPPESNGPRPFVYAAKAHPELIGPSSSDLLITYATNSFEFKDLFLPENASSLYWPRFVSAPIGK